METGLEGIGMTTLYVREDGQFQEASARQVLIEARELIEEQFRSRNVVLKTSEAIRGYLKIQLGGREHEVFAALFLDARRRLIEYVELFRGTIDVTAVYPREVVKEALERNAAAVIFAHNHPSGVADPSEQDEIITRRLRVALALVGVKVVDHLIVGESVSSLVEKGYLRVHSGDGITG
jgi:DNA repair protein RadC